MSYSFSFCLLVLLNICSLLPHTMATSTMPSSETNTTAIPSPETRTTAMPSSGIHPTTMLPSETTIMRSSETDPATIPLSKHYSRAGRFTTMICIIWTIILITTILVFHLPSTTGVITALIAATWLFTLVLVKAPATRSAFAYDDLTIMFCLTFWLILVSIVPCGDDWSYDRGESVKCSGTIQHSGLGSITDDGDLIALGMAGALICGLWFTISVLLFRDWNCQLDLNWQNIFKWQERACRGIDFQSNENCKEPKSDSGYRTIPQESV
ncbi:hypothetical protein EV702DRAFT_646602 [Suillus placidus]|uniref:MARVEL domain-containing protein n=1 Tax=Suillus placidus TaxID=48579 RepID=A0A9P7A3M3_9AGAM|nr:hypothetical protein EV702DRAFT_646602 [Suillus placidus]